ncbi:MAG: hypothetical protein ACJ8D9_11790 [Xanthobacteraceae bacterium]
MTNLPEMIPLTDADLDAVAGGQAVAAGGLVNIALSDINVDVLRNARFDIDVDIPVTIRNVANNNNIAVGALINVLGGPSAILQRQT